VKNIRHYFEKAKRQGFAIGAFNAANLEVVKAIVGAAEKLRSPVIIESSSGQTEYADEDNLFDFVQNAREETGLPIFLNLDHAHDLKLIKKAVKAGYDLIHFDGSKLLFRENMRRAKKVVSYVRKKRKGILVEAEIDYITGSSAPHLTKSIKAVQRQGNYTNPERARQFVKLTGVDTLAVFVGNVHGVYDAPPMLDFDRLNELSKLPCFLSLHGGSGIAAPTIKKTIETGRVVKINVNTELRMAYRKALEKQLKTSDEVAIYKLMPPVISAVQKVVEKKIRIFGSKGKV